MKVWFQFGRVSLQTVEVPWSLQVSLLPLPWMLDSSQHLRLDEFVERILSCAALKQKPWDHYVFMRYSYTVKGTLSCGGHSLYACVFCRASAPSAVPHSLIHAHSSSDHLMYSVFPHHCYNLMHALSTHARGHLVWKLLWNGYSGDSLIWWISYADHHCGSLSPAHGCYAQAWSVNGARHLFQSVSVA